MLIMGDVMTSVNRSCRSLRAVKFSSWMNQAVSYLNTISYLKMAKTPKSGTMPALVSEQNVGHSDRRATARQTSNLGVNMNKLILLAIAAMTFMATLPPGGKAGW